MTTKDDWKSFEELFEQHAGLSFEKQINFSEVIGSEPWQFDMGTGSISFGENLSFSVQIIGSLSFNDNSWMWGWANTKSGIPEHLLQKSNALKKLGEEKQIKELIEAHYSVDPNFEHKIGMIACGVFNANSYYCANYGQGTLVVIIDDKSIPKINMDNIERVMTSFPEFITTMDINHKSAFKNYLLDRGFQIKVEASKIEGLKNAKTITADFDTLDRLKNLNGTL
ncbi:hypothetical protein FHK87_07155 [Aquimarina algicola]|uniref:Uncharacterized protein n=1 Tax=Aquimarina algicola TaxID=2589995 RepID=A0A504JAY0_9FLAO|nr:hypothetical protein FHK87_07155 [Aquimarina algicola]